MDKERAAAPRAAEVAGRNVADGSADSTTDCPQAFRQPPANPSAAAAAAAAATLVPVDRHGKAGGATVRPRALVTTATPPMSPSVTHAAHAPSFPNPGPLHAHASLPHGVDQAHMRGATHDPNIIDHLGSPSGIRVPPLPPLGTPKTERDRAASEAAWRLLRQQTEPPQHRPDPVGSYSDGTLTARSLNLKSPRYRGPAPPLQRNHWAETCRFVLFMLAVPMLLVCIVLMLQLRDTIDPPVGNPLGDSAPLRGGGEAGVVTTVAPSAELVARCREVLDMAPGGYTHAHCSCPTAATATAAAAVAAAGAPQSEMLAACNSHEALALATIAKELQRWEGQQCAVVEVVQTEHSGPRHQQIDCRGPEDHKV